MPPRSLLVEILYNYFPKWPWIVIGVALMLMFVPEVERLSFIAINLSSIYLFAKIGTIIHESGHLMAAYWVGGKPKRMSLGTGHEIYRAEWKGLKIILNSVPIGGTANATFGDLPGIRWRLAFFLLGGVLFNVGAALIFYMLFGYDLSFSSGIHLSSTFIIVSALGVFNLIPYYTSHYGLPLPTDGLALLQTLFSRKRKFQNISYSEDYFEAFECYERREYEKTLSMYQTLNEKIEEDAIALSMMSVILLKQNKPDEAMPLLKKLEEKVQTKEFKGIKGVIYNNIAWGYLLKNDIPTAYHYSSQAIKALSKNKTVGGTYGCILIERGDIDIGMQWLLLNVDMKHPNDGTLVASMYLMLAYHLKNDLAKRDKHQKFVRENESKLDRDSLLLWERCLKKIEPHPLAS